MPINHPYDPRYNAKLYIPKLTEEERRAHATPLENLRSLRFRADPPAGPAAQPSPPKIATAVTATAQEPTPEAPTVEAPTAEVPTAEVPTPESALRKDPAPDYLPAAWEVVFAQFPELYPEHAERVVVAVAARGDAHAAHSQAVDRPRVMACLNRPESAAKMRTAASRQRREEHWVVLSSPADCPFHPDPGPPRHSDRQFQRPGPRRRARSAALRP